VTRGVRTGILVSIVLVVGVAAGALGWRWYAGLGGQHRPLFTLPDLDGQRHSISEWDGKLIVLNFWATWCAPCRKEAPLFVQLQKRYGDRGVQFVGVAVDKVEPVRRFVKEYNVNYPILHGIQNAMDAGALYGDQEGTLPYTVVIGRDGRIRRIFQKRVERVDLEPVLKDATAS